MSFNDTALTILHVEDDPQLAKLVQTAFAGFGFRGKMLWAGRVDEALQLLDQRARNGEPVNLILADMQLPDGLGLDLIREVKSDPAWQATPIIVLSGEVATGMINGAYALGANCYVPKIARVKNSSTSLKTLYTCWCEVALLPEFPPRDHMQDVLARAIRLRARTSDFYLRLARVYDGEPEELGFWLDRSLNEGNLSNLLAFFRNILSESDMSAGTIDRIAGMQAEVRKALAAAESRLSRKPAPSPEEVCRWVLDLMVVLDEEVVAEVLGSFFSKGPEATAALKARAAAQLMDLANHIMERTEDVDLRQRARDLVAWSERLSAGT
jgi:CheY-like chemotaxis protein